ncbi:hypothetical protein CH293_07055 [Rhodococcus sp. 14-2470-1b]|uniref:glycosyltransferase family 4 protein n=1 Tax=Rhodococcus sp. 14-2470-1b TaxID=2023149 RepID=UPI000B9A7AA7|nr:glycosyltransferase family 4 protein [Rhodococcus sp. 14-2470-1b]OZF54476.1 hypothetical protein CH293_07055 [Rhodococcus sp. 14-2470-1b]
MAAARKILVSHPSPDLYGSDLQLLETIDALVELNCEVIVVLPSVGPLQRLIRQRGATTKVMDFPVSRKSHLTVKGLPKYAVQSVIAVITLTAVLKQVKPDVIYANTITAPVWFLVGRICRVPVICHVHEAEELTNKTLTRALLLPLVLCRALIINSKASYRVIVRTFPALKNRAVVIYNGISHDDVKPAPAAPSKGVYRLALVGRLSPRKGTDIALDALGLLVAEGYNVEITLYGDSFPGYEWFESQLKRRALKPDLSGRVVFAGYVEDAKTKLRDADIILVPSLAEPFGNVAVEAQLANRPLIATNVQGLSEIVEDGHTGSLTVAGDPYALAASVSHVINNWADALRIADYAYESAVDRFGVQRYRKEIAGHVAQLLKSRKSGIDKGRR